MARRLILDTGVLIATERGLSALAELLTDDDDVAIAAITVAELQAGVDLADDLHRPARSKFVDRVLEALPVEPYDLVTAKVHGHLLAHVHRSGRKREAHDLLVAAAAIATRRTVLTTDRNAQFAALPGVSCIVVG